MKISKLLLAVISAAVLLGSLGGSAFARNLSDSEISNRALWTILNLRGGFGTVECEFLASGSFHTRTISKVVGTLVGYITEARILRCRRGGATVNGASLPWHRRYRGFTGTLPNITGVSETITGVEYTIREPTFGITCTVRRESSSTMVTVELTAGVVTAARVGGTSPCGEFSAVLEGSTTNTLGLSGARVTVTLI